MLVVFFSQIVLLVLALSLDAFAAGFSYGAGKIKIPFISALIISIICTAVLAAALFLGQFVASFISPLVSLWVSFAILLLIGLIKLFDALVKSYIKKHKGLDKEVTLKIFSLRFVLGIYADPIEADKDESKVLSAGEAVGLALALSLDSLTVGFGAGMEIGGFIWLIGLSLVFSIALLYLGGFLGKLLSEKSKVNLSWLSGAILIALAVARVIMEYAGL